MDEDREPIALVHITTVPESLFFLAGQVGRAKAMGLHVRAMSSPGPMLVQFGEQQDVPVHAVDMPRSITPARDTRALLRMTRALRKLKPTIVHAHTPKGGLLGTLAARLAGVPIAIYHIHGLPLTTAKGTRRRILRATEKTSCRFAHQVIAVSHSMRDVVVREGLCPPGKVKVLRGGSINGVDADGRFDPHAIGHTRSEVRARYGIPESAIVIGFVGRIVRDKGLCELCDAWRALRDEWLDLHLILVGPFEPQDPVPHDVEHALRADPRVHLVGLDWETPPLYSAMDIVALPTYREGFPTVPLEAAAMSLPIVATQVPGCVDAVVDGVTGTLVPARDAAALADALRGYMRDPNLRSMHGAAGRERVLRDFRREDMWDAVCDEYARLLAGRGISLPARAVDPAAAG